ncbi:hypothetical protein B0H12DRAFT_1072936 [Mycena haematopus]|nr:hypothetical protein B0H12DRAFT_1072936 [Mycena haematopus]
MASTKCKAKHKPAKPAEDLRDSTAVPPKRKRGRPPKPVEEATERAEDPVPKLTLRLPVPKPTSSSDSDILLLDPSDTSEHDSNMPGEDGDEEDAEDEEDREEDDEEEEEEEEEEEPRRKKVKKIEHFELQFLVPVGGATDTLTLSSTISHKEFLRAVGDEMDLRPKDVDIAYRFNFWTQKEPLRVLRTEKHLTGLFKLARKELQERFEGTTKRNKEIEVTIANMGGKEKVKKGKGAEKTKALSRRKYTDSSDGSDDDDARPPKKKSGAEFLRELHAKHKCETHGSFCLVAKNGEHIALSDQKISLWSMLLV